MNTRAKRFLAVGLLSGSLLSPAIASAQTMPTGTVTGTITCGTGDQPADVAPESTEISLQGSDLSTRTLQGGRFILTGVPASAVFTLDVVASPDSFETSNVPGISVGASQTLDVGTIDLSVCPAPTTIDDQAQADTPNDAVSDNQGDTSGQP